MSDHRKIVNYGECKQQVCLLEYKKSRLARKWNRCLGNKIIPASQKNFRLDFAHMICNAARLGFGRAVKNVYIYLHIITPNL
jgi:hypothetical protein